MNKRYFASAIITGALLASGSAFAANSGAPSNTPNDSTGVPLNKPTTQGATAPAPAGSTSTMGAGKTSTHSNGSHMGKTHSGSKTMPAAGANNGSGSNMQPATTNRGNAAQPSQPRPVTGN